MTYLLWAVALIILFLVERKRKIEQKRNDTEKGGGSLGN